MRRRRRDERGAVALLVGILMPLVLVGVAAFAIDISRWELERQRMQTAADAAAAAAVPYLPYDLASATTRARQVAARNGYDHNDPDVEVLVERGVKPGQLRVEIVSRIHNSFGAMMGVTSATLKAVAVADYQAPAPMGSPCNTFGNEPTAGSGASSARPIGSAHGSPPFQNCSAQPQLWASVQGPETGKVQGDRYQTRGCEASGVAGCSGPANDEYDEFGYVFVVKVEQAAVGSVIDLQLFDPMFLNTGQTCALLPSSSEFDNNSNATNPHVHNSDARSRYTRNGSGSDDFCTGDSFPGQVASIPNRVVTSFVLRQQVDSQDPEEAPVQAGVDGTGCIRQYGGLSTGRDQYGNFARIPAAVFKASSGSYIPDLAQSFHNWTSFCRFQPDRAGDYYLQVRTNVGLGGSGSTYTRSGNQAALAPTGNTYQGAGANAFSIRAVTPGGLERSVAVSGYEHMPIYVNAPSATSTFNLLRVLPGAAGRRISFEFFDAADISGTGGGTVRVSMPDDATFTGAAFPNGCTSDGGAAGSGHSSAICQVPVSKSANNGQVQRMSIPIPADYSCNALSLDGCWYRVTISFPGATVTDQTTWNARILGDPVRLIE